MNGATFRILVGDALARLRELPDASAHVLVTSPPYWNLRDYGVAGQLGHESSPQAHVAAMVAVFQEVRRVLRPDATAWVNLGDSYVTRWGSRRPDNQRGHGSQERERSGAVPEGLKEKDLLGMPWRVAFGLQEAGWWLRSDNIWHKTNPQPEAAEDRPTRDHESVFQFVPGRQLRRAVQFADLEPERVHVPRRLFAPNPYVGTAGLCVALAASILEAAEEQRHLRLPTLDPEEGQQLPEQHRREPVGDLPPMERAASYAARLLDGEASTKEFLSQCQRLWCDLSEEDQLRVRRGLTAGLPGSVLVDGDAAVAVHHAGQVSEIDFAHGQVITTRWRGSAYFYDAEAVREPTTGTAHTRGKGTHRKSAAAGSGVRQNVSFSAAVRGLVAKRNLRTVWSFQTQPQPEAHFATYPLELPLRCILAGTSEVGCCRLCGAPYARLVDKARTLDGEVAELPPRKNQDRNAPDTATGVGHWRTGTATATTGWEATCRCPLGPPIPCTVLDCFGGLMTTGEAALKLGRNFVGVELNPEYAALGERRLLQVANAHPEHVPAPKAEGAKARPVQLALTDRR